jgi:hypothetical protein
LSIFDCNNVIIYAEGTDLIYEGITTLRSAYSFSELQEGTDLIYEGITTTVCTSPVRRTPRLPEGTDLIYEGITTFTCRFVHNLIS